MPELPEVETVRRGLTRLVKGHVVESTEVRWSKTVSNLTPEEFDAELAGRKIERIDRRGKYLLFRFSGDLTMVSHLRMEGSYYTVPRGTEPGKHDLVTFHLDDDVDLFYRDTRKFGRMTVVPNTQLDQVPGLSTLGPEPTEDALDFNYMKRIFNKSNARIKPFLLDQSHIAGIGNIYADETLWQSKIHPKTHVNALTDDEIHTLRNKIIAEMARSIEHHGTTVHSFTNVFGEAGEFQNELEVYGRAGEPCLRCGTVLEKIKVAQRGTTFCPHCQVERD